MSWKSGRRHTIRLGRWSVTFQRHHGVRYAQFPARYTSGGKATPGPWWALDVWGVGAIVLGHDETLFGWGDQANVDTSAPEEAS